MSFICIIENSICSLSMIFEHSMNGLCNVFHRNIECYEHNIFLIFVSGKSFFLSISPFSLFIFSADNFWDSPFPMFYFYLYTFALLLQRSNLEALILILLSFLFFYYQWIRSKITEKKKLMRHGIHIVMMPVWRFVSFC